jgi:hypothetical protein
VFSRWSEIKEAPARLGSRTRDRLARIRTAGSREWVRLRARALDGADGWVGRIETWPAIRRIAGPASRLVDRQRERWGVVPVDGWDKLNAKDAIKAVARLDVVGLRVARQQEVAAKNRATVVRAIDDQLAKRSVPAESTAA